MAQKVKPGRSSAGVCLLPSPLLFEREKGRQCLLRAGHLECGKEDEEGGSRDHHALAGHTDLNKVCPAAEGGGALELDQGVFRSGGGIQARTTCKVAMTTAGVREQEAASRAGKDESE